MKQIVKRMALLIAIIALSTTVGAQSLRTAYTYSTGIDSTLWIDIDNVGIDIMATGNTYSASQVQNIGFPFRYEGVEYTQFSVNKFGAFRFGSDRVTSAYYSRPLGNNRSYYVPGLVALGANAYATNADGNGYARYATLGSEGNRVMVLEMKLKIYGATGGIVRLQVQLYEATNSLTLIYAPIEGNAPVGAYQIGFVMRADDVALISLPADTLVYSTNTNATNAGGTWPDAWQWYRLDYDASYCDHFTTPFVEDFQSEDNLGCWTNLNLDNSSYTQWVRSQYPSSNWTMWAYRNNSECNDWLITPPIALSDTADGLMLSYDFFCESSRNDPGEMDVRLAVYDSVVSEVDTADFTVYLRHEHSTTDGMEPRGVSLGAWAGRIVRVAFVHVGTHPNHNIVIDNVKLRNTTLPKVRVEAPQRAHAHDTTLVNAEIYEGVHSGLTYTWVSAMASRSMATFGRQDSLLQIVYLGSGSDTIMCIASNAYGSDTTVAMVDVVDCTTVTSYPWSDDFSHGLDCWYQLGGWSASGTFTGGDNEALQSNMSTWQSATSSHWIISQPFAIPADTSLWMRAIWKMRTPSQDSYSNNIFSFRVAAVTSDAIPSLEDFSIVMTDTMYYGPWEEYRIDLAPYAGQTVRFMFYNTPSHSGMGIYDCILIDDIEVRSARVPRVELTAPNRVDSLGPVRYTADWLEGSPEGRTYIWHSAAVSAGHAAMVDSGSFVDIVYFRNYDDTVTVVAANVWGSDTAIATSTVCDCPAQSLPWSDTFADSTTLYCWIGYTRNSFSGEISTDVFPLQRVGNDSTGYYMKFPQYSSSHAFFISPAVDIPNDTTDLYVYWRVYDPSYNAFHVYVTADSNYNNRSSYIELTGSTVDGKRRASLAEYAGERIHIVFTGGYGQRLYEVHIMNDTSAPSASLTAPDTLFEGETAHLSATVTQCSRRGYAVRWNSTMASAGLAVLDTTSLVAPTISYLAGGIDTVTLIVRNDFGADTQQAIIHVQSCSPQELPLSEDFRSTPAIGRSGVGSLPRCWNKSWYGNSSNAPHVMTASTYPFSNINKPFVIMMAGNTSGYAPSAMVILPEIDELLYNVSMAVDYAYEDANSGTLEVGYIDSSHFFPVATLLPSHTTDTVNFSAAPTSAQWIAFRWQYNDNSWYSAAIKEVRVFLTDSTSVPRSVSISGPSHIQAFDTATFTTIIRHASSTAYTYHWTSPMLQRNQATIDTATAGQSRWTYSAVGTDTIQCIVTDSTGSDTARFVVNITGLPIVHINGSTTITDGRTTTFSAVFTGGVDSNIVYTWHSTMASDGAATINTAAGTCHIIYHAAGTDTLSLTATSILGATTVKKVITVQACPHINDFPYQESFQSGMPSCWLVESIPAGISSPWIHSTYNGQYLESHNSSSAQSLWLMLPVIDLPDTGSAMGLYFSVRYWYGSGLTVRVSPSGVADTVAFTDTLFVENGTDNAFVPRAVSLANYRGQSIRVAFVHRAPCNAIYLDDVSIKPYGLPTIALTGPSQVRSCDTARFQASLLTGDTAGLTFTWNSALASRGDAAIQQVDSILNVDYYTGGTDQVTVIATNAYGSDTAMMQCTVIDCEAITQFPYVQPIKSATDLTCWNRYNYGDNPWQFSGYWWDTEEGVCINTGVFSTDDAWLVSRPIVVPADPSLNVTLQWHIRCMHASYQVLLSDQGFHSTHLFSDTLLTEHHDTLSWTTRSLSLNAYRGQTVSIAFRSIGHYTGGDYNDLGSIYIDTVSVITTPDTIRHTLSAIAADSTMGTVQGSGIYDDSTLVTITATPHSGYHFSHWNDGDTFNPRHILLTSDTLLVAYFSPIPRDTAHYHLEVSSADSTMGIVTGSGIYADSTLVTITATPHTGYHFSHWNDGDTLNPRLILLTSDTLLIAHFLPNSDDSVGIYSPLPTLLELFPNPSNGAVTIRVDRPAVVSIIDLSGRTLLAPQAIEASLHLPSLPAGTYYVRVATSEGFIVRKLIVIR